MSDGDLLTIVSEFRDGFLEGMASTGMCLAMCSSLEGYLRACGIETYAVAGAVDCRGYYADHFWMKLSDDRIVDPTADQFPTLNMPPVYIGPMPNNYYPNAWGTEQ